MQLFLEGLRRSRIGALLLRAGRLCLAAVFLMICVLVWRTVVPAARAQDTTPPEPAPTAIPSDRGDDLTVPGSVDVQPGAQDEDIAGRLQDILEVTGWFDAPQVSVRNGVVFLDGRTEIEERRTWAGNLASRTEDVVAVVNRIQVTGRSPWDFSPALEEINRFVRGFIVALPQLAFGFLILLVTWLLARLVIAVSRRLLRNSIQTPLLRDVASKAIGIPILIVGIYLVLQAFGLTRLALTVLGGTGVAGLVIGIAFSDIVENFLASILISVRQPFASGDLIKIGEFSGVVQRVTTRSTLLMSLDGNHVQIPNATIYKSNIVNYTSNPNRRVEFGVGISYQSVISDAQEAVLTMLAQHPAVLPHPEPLVLAENLGPGGVELRVYFWIDSSTHDFFKAKSSVIRLTKRTLQEAGFAMPDPQRYQVVLQGDEVRLADQRGQPLAGSSKPGLPVPRKTEPGAVATPAEGELGSEDETLREQARKARIPEQGRNLLEGES